MTRAENESPGKAAAAAADPAPPKANGDEPEPGDYRPPIPMGSASAGRNLFYGCAINAGDFTVGDGAPRDGGAADVTAWAEQAAKGFVPPAAFGELVAALERDRVVLLVGPGWGKATAAAAALKALGRRPVFQLPAALDVGGIVDGVKQGCADDPGAGFLVDALDADSVARLTGFELRRLRAALTDDSAVVLTTDERAAQLACPDGLRAIEAEPPDPSLVADAAAREHGLDEHAAERAAAAVKLLTPPVSPRTAVRVVAAAGESDASPEDLAASFDADPAVLDEWLGQRPTAQRLAFLAAAATLDGTPTAALDPEAARLAELLEGDVEPSSEPRSFGPVDRGWPAGVARVKRAPVLTSFGTRDTEVVEICSPHDRVRIVTYLWSRLGQDFRRPYLEWLRSLPRSDNGAARWGAAVTAGVLFTIDPLVAQGELIDPWVANGSRRHVSCAGQALGTPAAIGEDPASSRRLVARWAGAGESNRRRAAIFAYGGLLGVYDPGARAARALWDIGVDDARLRGMADRALVFLLAGGPDAAYARSSVIALIAARAGRHPEPRRAYALLPRVMGVLAAPDAVSRGSLTELLDDAERESFATLAATMARGFDQPTGRDSADAALRVLLRRLGEGAIDQDVVNRLIRAMKQAARERGRLAALGTQIERVLRREIRADGPTGEAARSVHSTFYDRQERDS
jgi:hypothetical protein